LVFQDINRSWPFLFFAKTSFCWNNFSILVSLVSRQAVFNYHYDGNDGDDADIFYANKERHHRHQRHHIQLSQKGGKML